jgi:hypothetical protein
MKYDENLNLLKSRREALKKTALFVVPTIMTFNLKDVQAKVSGKPTGVTGSGGKKDDNNGNHYGNDKPDQNQHDTHNSHNGWDDTTWKNNKGKGKK